MKSLFEPATKAEVLKRIETMTPQAQRQWGKMDQAQVLAHCCAGLEMAMGIINPKRVFIGRLIGPLFRKKYSDEKPFDKESPTSEELKMTGRTPDFQKEKQRLIELVKKFSDGGEAIVTKNPHPFFGPLKPLEWGIGMYKHIDHHLRQFSN